VDEKGKKLAILVVVAALGFGIYIVARSGLFYMKVNERVKNLDRFVTPDQILALPAQIKEDAAHYHVPLDTLKIEIAVDGRMVQNDVYMFFLVVAVTNGTSKTQKEEHILEGGKSLTDTDTRKKLEDGGVKFTGRMPER
jgi:hypothetical protein